MQYVEPYKIKVVEPIKKNTKEQRELWIKEAKYNLYNLRGNQVFIDLISDSGTASLSNVQCAEMILADECYAGESSYYFLKDIVNEITSCKYCFPTHQGRAAENILYSVMVKKGDIIPGNIHYNTTSSHIEKNGGVPLNCVSDSSLNITSEELFKGNIDLDKLDTVIKKYKDKIPFILITITCNTLGCHPVSMSNIRSVSLKCKENNIPLFFDASRFAENAYLIKIREDGYKYKNINEIIKEMFSYVDGFVMSGKKDGLSTIGGIIGLKSEKNFNSILNNCLLYEGYYTHGGMSSRDLKMLGQG